MGGADTGQLLWAPPCEDSHPHAPLRPPSMSAEIPRVPRGRGRPHLRMANGHMSPHGCDLRAGTLGDGAAPQGPPQSSPLLLPWINGALPRVNQMARCSGLTHPALLDPQVSSRTHIPNEHLAGAGPGVMPSARSLPGLSAHTTPRTTTALDSPAGRQHPACNDPLLAWPSRPKIHQVQGLSGASLKEAETRQPLDGFWGEARRGLASLSHITVSGSKAKTWTHLNAAPDTVHVQSGLIFAGNSRVFSRRFLFSQEGRTPRRPGQPHPCVCVSSLSVVALTQPHHSASRPQPRGSGFGGRGNGPCLPISSC